MKFDVMDRLLMLKALGAVEGNLATLRVVRDLQGEIGFSEEELKELGLHQEGGRTFWEQNKVSPKEVSIGPAALEASLSMFQKLDQAQKLTIEYLPLYERLLKEKGEISSTPKLHEAGAPGA